MKNGDKNVINLSAAMKYRRRMLAVRLTSVFFIATFQNLVHYFRNPRTATRNSAQFISVNENQ